MTVERFANDAATHLDLAAGIGDLSIKVQNVTHFPTQPEFRVRVSDEKMLVTGVVGTTWTVTRGIEGTIATSHSAGTLVVAVLTAGGLDEMRGEIEAEIPQNTVQNTDPRLSDSRTPLTHAGTHAPGNTDAIATGTTNVTVCIGNDARLSDDRTASGIRSVTAVVSVSSATAPTAGQVLTATSGTAADWETPPPQGNSVTKPKIQPNGATVSDVALPSDSSTAILAVNLQTIGLAVSTIYQTVVTIRAVIYEDAIKEIVGSLDLVSDMTVVVDSAGNVFCGFNATQSPDLSRLVGTPLQGATITLAASTNGFTVKITRPTGINCHARCSWITNIFENIAVEPDYPQAGSWATGGYWDADHGITLSGPNITAAASREGASVLTGTGTLTIVNDPLTNTNVVQGNVSTSYLQEIDSVRWGKFGGLHTPYIAFMQVTFDAAPTTDSRHINIVGATHRALDVVLEGTTDMAYY